MIVIKVPVIQIVLNSGLNVFYFLIMFAFLFLMSLFHTSTVLFNYVGLICGHFFSV